MASSSLLSNRLTAVTSFLCLLIIYTCHTIVHASLGPDQSINNHIRELNLDLDQPSYLSSSLDHHHWLTKREDVQPLKSVDPKTEIEDDLLVNSNLTSVYFLNDTHEHLLIKWVGGNSSVLVCLAKYRTTKYSGKNADMLRNLTSNLYISYDYGTSFNKIQNLRLADNSREPLISNFYISDVMNTHFLFTDVINNHVFVTQDYGRTFQTVNTTFSPKLIQLHSTKPQLILASDENNSDDDQLYFSNDFGINWNVIAKNVKRFVWGNSNDHRNRIFIQKRRTNGHFDLLSSDDFFQKDEKVWLANVNEFRLSNQYLLITRNLTLLGNRNKEKNLELWVSYNRSSPMKAIFDRMKHSVKVTDFFVADSSEDEILLAVRFNDSTTDLYISNREGDRFQLSLSHLVTSSTGSSSSSISNAQNKISTVDIHKVAGLEGIFIANVYQDPAKRNEFNQIRTLITFDKGASWQSLKAPTHDMHDDPYHCVNNNCSLYLIQNDMPSPFKYQPIMSKESAVGLVLAAGIMQGQKDQPGIVSNNNVPNLFISRDAGLNWREVFDGRYIFNMGDFGGIIVAIKHYSKLNVTDRLEYSLDEGETWTPLRFINQTIKVYSLLIENGEKTSTFTIFGSLNTDRHRWVLVKVNLTSLVENRCSFERDYEFWTPHRPNSKCLMGRREIFYRRKPRAHCLNGEDFAKVYSKLTENCACTRDDYECDFGYINDGTGMCLAEDDDTNLQPLDCTPGRFFTVTQGYRKVIGNTCIEPASSAYSPITKMCPAAQTAESRGRSVLKAILLSLMCTTMIFASVFGVFYFLRTKNSRSSNFFNLTSTHYSRRSDSAILLDADDLDNDDGPVIRGFSDDVPMVVS